MLWSFASIHILKMLIIFAGLFHGYRQVKTSILLYSAIFERKGKSDGYFRQLALTSARFKSDTDDQIVRKTTFI